MSNVLHRNPHKLGETVIRVSALKPQPPPDLILHEPIDEERLLVKKLPPGCCLEELQKFIRRASAAQIVRWRIGAKPTTALLDFDTVPGIYCVCVLYKYDTSLMFSPVQWLPVLSNIVPAYLRRISASVKILDKIRLHPNLPVFKDIYEPPEF